MDASAHLIRSCRFPNRSSLDAPRRGRVRRGALSLVLLALAFAVSAPTARAVSFSAASKAALKATQSERRGGPAILFGLHAPLRTGTAVREAGRRQPPTGPGSQTLPVALRVADGPAYFFYLDLSPYQHYQHAGRVILVNKRSGAVRRSRRLNFQPVFNGKRPPFLRSRRTYERASYRVFSSDYAAGNLRAARETPVQDAFGLGFGLGTRARLRSAASEGALAGALSDEKSCTVSVSSSLAKIDGALASLGSSAGASVLPLFAYSALSGKSLESFISSDVIAGAGCKDILIAISGDGYRSAPEPTVRTGLSLTASKAREVHVTASLLRKIIAANPQTTFKLMLDAPGSGAFIDPLKSLSNVLVVATSSKAGQPAFRYLPRKRIDGRLVVNPVRMRADSSFFTTQLLAAAGFAASDAEVAQAIAEVAEGRAPSVLAWMIARSFELSAPFDFTADLGATPQLYTRFTITEPPPGPGSGPGPGPGPGPGNGRPTANGQSVVTPEDTPKAITLSGTDPEGKALTFAVAGQPAHGSLSGTAADLTYTPAANYHGADSFTFAVSDGSLTSSPATVSITVSAVDDPPAAVDDAGSVDEDSGATAVAVLSNDTDPDGGPISLASVTQPADGTVAITGGGTGLTYEPDADYCNDPSGGPPDTFTYTLNGGSSATVSMTVMCVNDRPVTSASGTLAYTENDPPTAIAPALTVADVDSANLTGATARITGNYQSGEDLLALPSQPAIAGAFDAATGTLTLTGTATVAAYRTALRAATYANSSDNPDTGPRTVTFAARDAGGLGSAGTRTITVAAVNDLPSITTSAGPIGYAEADPATPIDPALVLADPDSPIVLATIQLTNNYVAAEDVLALSGSHPGITATSSVSGDTLTLTGPASVAAFESALRSVTYRNASSSPSVAPRTATFIANDPMGASTPQTRAINVSASDDAPDVNTSSGSLAYTENSPATGIDTAIAITDPDSPDLIGATVQITGGYVNGEDILALPAQPVITSAFDALTGRLTLSGSASVAAYETALEAVTYANASDNPSTLPRTVTYAARDAGGFGTPGAHGIEITAVDDAPLAVDDSATVVEGSGPAAVAVLSNDTDVDAGPISIAAVTQPAHGGVVVTGAGTGLTYEPGSNYCNDPDPAPVDAFTYTLDGGSTATVSITVTCVDDPPVAVDDGATVLEDSGAAAVAVLSNDTDVDAGPISIAAVTQPAHGGVVVTGAGTGLTYEPGSNYCNDPDPAPVDAFTYTLNGGSTATVSMTVTCVDDPPVAVDDGATVLEDSGATAVAVLTNDTDIDSGPKVYTSFTQPAQGTVIDGGGTLTYEPAASYCNSQAGGTPDTFTYTLNGGSSATVAVTVTCVPDEPNVATSPGIVIYTENDLATAIDAGIDVSDPDPGATFPGAAVRITANFASSEDALALAGSHPGISAVFAGDTLTLTGSATPADYQAALRDVTYHNSSDSPSTLARTITFTVTDETARTGSGSRGVQVAAVQDPPVGVNDSATVLEDSGATAVAVLTNDTDVDGGPKTIGPVTQPAHGSVVITGGGTGLTYAPDANYCNDPSGGPADTFTYTLNGGSTATVAMTVTCVNDAPVADDETFDAASSAVGNTGLVGDDPSDGPPVLGGPKKTITADILAGDSDLDGPGPLTVIAGTFASNDGGSVTLQADGDFTYTPAAGTSCTDASDFFDYTVSDQNPGTPATDIGRVNIAIAGCVWYVSNDAAGNSGTSTAPFDTLAQAESASGAGHTIFLYDGDNSTTGYAAGIDLKPNQRLLGEAATLTVGADTLQAADAAKRPTITDNNADVVALASGNIVRGVELNPQGSGGGIAGGAGDSGGTIDDVRIIDSATAGTQPGLELNGTSGTFDISDLTIDNTTATGTTGGSLGVLLNNAGTVNFKSAGTNAITTQGAKGLDVTGTSLGAGSVVDAITVTGSGTGAVSMVGTTGTMSLGDGNATDLSLTTTSGTAPALNLSNAGSVTVPSTGTANVSATGGPAIDVTATNAVSLSFDNVDSTSSANDAINLDGLGSGTFSATGGTLSGYSGIAFDLNGGSGNVSYAGAIANGPGQSAEITGRTNGSVTLSGPINDTSDAGGGVVLSGNTGGSTTFSNATKTINTTSAGTLAQNDAIVMSSNGGHSMTFSGGGLNVDTGTGTGLLASGGGTLQVTGGANTIDSATGKALSVTSTDFAGSGAIFEHISAGTAAAGPANGIVLNSTGSSAGLNVTGNGGACTVASPTCTGGSIQRTTGDAVSLTATSSPSLSLMNVHDAAGNGVLASDVSALSLASSIFVNNSDDIATNNEGNLRLLNLTGTSSVTNSVFREARSNNVYWTPTAGAMAMSWTGNTVGPANAGELGAGLLVNSSGTAGVALNVSGGSFAGNNGDSLRPAAAGSSALNVTVSGATAFADSNSGVNFSADQDADVTFDVSGATFVRHASHALQMIVNDNTTAASIVRGTVANNVIGGGTPDSGSHDANGISYQLGGGADIRMAVTGNTVRNTDTQGIFIQSVRFPSGTAALGPNVDLTLRNNTVSSIDDNSPFPFGFQYGTQIEARRNSNMCLDIAGNASTGIGGAERFRVRQRDAATLRLERLTGAGTDDSNVASFVAAQNAAGSTASATHATSFTSVPDGTCQAP